MRESFVRISSLLWADVLVAYALFVMQDYLTDVWKLSLTHAAAILNFWNGIHRILPVFFLYLVDSFLGNFKLLVFTTIAYATGITLVAMSTPPILADSVNTCKQYEPQCIGPTQKRLLYAGLVLIAVGIAGNCVSLKPFLAEQREEEAAGYATRSNNADPPPHSDGYQLLGLVGVVVLAIAGAVGLPYIKPWPLRFWIPAGCTALGTLLFLSGVCIAPYNRRPPAGSPLCNVSRVFVAALLNTFQPYQPDNHRRFSKTSCLRGLHKATIQPADEENREISRWKLCTVAEVEDAKIAVRMVPMWMTFILCGVVASAGDTYFVEHADKLDRRIGKLKLPIQVLLLARESTKGWLDGKLKQGFETRRDAAAPFWMRWRRYHCAPSIGIGIGMICGILCCISAAGVEKMRLAVVREHDLLDKPDENVPFSIYWLLFQFVLLGGLESFLEKSVNAYYREQSPESMERYLEKFTRGVSGLGYMSSTLAVYVVGRVSERGGRRNWFQETLNMSRLDKYYRVLAALSCLNLAVFVVVATRYRYKVPAEIGRDAVDAGGDYTDGYDEASACFGCC